MGKRKGMKLQRAKRVGHQRKTNKDSFDELYFVYVEVKWDVFYNDLMKQFSSSEYGCFLY